MIELRPFNKLGGADHGWLKAKHHFSFGSHYDPGNLGHGSLRVWNDDEIAPNTGFPAHPHANMEIITYVREGAITHQDSLGNKGRTEAGDVQVMSAGSGIRHSEYNLEPTKTKIFQIWIEPTTQGGQPTCGAKPSPQADRNKTTHCQTQGKSSWPKYSCSIIPPTVTSKQWRMPSPKAPAKPARPSTSSACRNPCRPKSPRRRITRWTRPRRSRRSRNSPI